MRYSGFFLAFCCFFFLVFSRIPRFSNFGLSFYSSLIDFNNVFHWARPSTVFASVSRLKILRHIFPANIFSTHALFIHPFFELKFFTPIFPLQFCSPTLFFSFVVFHIPIFHPNFHTTIFFNEAYFFHTFSELEFFTPIFTQQFFFIAHFFNASSDLEFLT